MYIDAKRIGNKIYVSSRTDEGRTIKAHDPIYNTYYEDVDGEYTSIHGDKLSKYSTNSWFEHQDAIREVEQNELRHFETDVTPEFNLLETLYPEDDAPPLNISVFDIEVDKDPELGFATIDNPYAPINAISIHNKWDDLRVAILVPPENLTMEEARDLLDGKLFQDAQGNLITEAPEGDTFGSLSEVDGYFLVESEEDLLRLMIELWVEADVLTGWNSNFFDIPYIIHRIRIVLGGEDISVFQFEKGTKEAPVLPSEESQYWLRQLTLFPTDPYLRMADRYGSTEKTYSLSGRIHLDYLELYQKFTYEELHSYALDYVLQIEVNQQKVEYEGSLDQLYRWDFRRFAAYSMQDTMGLSAIDDKNRFIALANTMAHSACVTLDKTLGTVSFVEHAILKELHREGQICFNKSEKHRDYPIPGAFVLDPTKGIYEWATSYDFNSLYPTVIRMLNLSPETIIGFVNPSETLKQLNQFMEDGMTPAGAWRQFDGTLEYQHVVNQSDDIVEFQIEADKELVMSDEGLMIEQPRSEFVSAKELHQRIKDNDWMITAFGVVTTREYQGIIPKVLEKWYNGRVVSKGKAKAAWKLKETTSDPEIEAQATEDFLFYDLLQLNEKIKLNSAYGSLLNAHCRFYDPRLGASTTMSGKVCLGAMVANIVTLLNTSILHPVK